LCIKGEKRFDANLLSATARGIHNTGAQCRSHSEKESVFYSDDGCFTPT
jgi:hypothetical protein